jgi:ABC-type glycerol-3-phosphate transport system substrate-binding protein
MKKILALVLALVMVFALSVTAFADEKAPEDYAGTLTIYSPHDSDPLNDGVAAFEALYPNVKVEVIADGTSNLVAKIAAESAAPVADVLSSFMRDADPRTLYVTDGVHPSERGSLLAAEAIAAAIEAMDG